MLTNRDLGRPTQFLLEGTNETRQSFMRSIELIEREVLSIGIGTTDMQIYSAMQLRGGPSKITISTSWVEGLAARLNPEASKDPATLILHTFTQGCAARLPLVLTIGSGATEVIRSLVGRNS